MAEQDTNQANNYAFLWYRRFSRYYDELEYKERLGIPSEDPLLEVPRG